MPSQKDLANSVSLAHGYFLDLAGYRCGDVGFHLHRFQDHHQIVCLQYLAGLDIELHDHSRYRTAADFCLVDIRVP